MAINTVTKALLNRKRSTYYFNFTFNRLLEEVGIAHRIPSNSVFGFQLCWSGCGRLVVPTGARINYGRRGALPSARDGGVEFVVRGEIVMMFIYSEWMALAIEEIQIQLFLN